MDQEMEIILPEELPFNIDEVKWGEARGAELVCPGVYQLETCVDSYYVVMKNDSVISLEALSYGVDEGGAIFFPMESENGGVHVIQYEIERYFLRNGRSIRYDTLHSIAQAGGVETPAYFGVSAPPSMTPFGYMTRYLYIDRGIYWLESDQCTQMLAVSPFIWDTVLSETVNQYGTILEMDSPSVGVLGYRFFHKTLCAAVLYELRRLRKYPGLEQLITSDEDLLAAISWQTPDYPLKRTMQEQVGLENGMSQFIRSLGVDVPELEQPSKEVIPYIQDAPENEFLRLPDSWHIDKAISGRVRD